MWVLEKCSNYSNIWKAYLSLINTKWITASVHCFGFKGSQCQAELIRLQVFVGNAQTTINTVHSIKALDHKPSEKKKMADAVRN